MLRKIPKILPPDLVKYMMEMGHGDTLVIADAHFPAYSVGQRVIDCSGVSADDMLNAILSLMPLDTYVDYTVELMQVVEGDAKPEIWNSFKRTLYSFGFDKDFGFIERFAFYEAAKKSYVVIRTGETASYANIILHKGNTEN